MPHAASRSHRYGHLTFRGTRCQRCTKKWTVFEATGATVEFTSLLSATLVDGETCECATKGGGGRRGVRTRLQQNRSIATAVRHRGERFDLFKVNQALSSTATPAHPLAHTHRLERVPRRRQYSSTHACTYTQPGPPASEQT